MFISAVLNGGELSYKISGEGGGARTAFDLFTPQRFALGRFFGQLRYQEKNRSYDWMLQGNFRPELYLSTTTTAILTLNLKMQFLKKGRHFHWQFFFENKQQYLRLSENNFGIDVIQIGGQGIWPLRPGNILTLTTGYHARDFSGSFDNQIDALNAVLQWRKSIKGATRLLTGFYGETFDISSITNLTQFGSRDNNQGFRFGPEIGLMHKRNYVFNGIYRFLLHRSDITDSDAHEHHIRLLAGKLISRDWSLFFLLDYYIRDLSLENQENINLLYTPIDTENRFYIKLERELDTRSTLFFRIDYLNEDLARQGVNYSGWQGTIGLSFRD